jgi:hypothetical protein
MPTLLRTRPLPLQLVLAAIIPLAYGALCGWLATVNKTAYVVLTLLAVVGAYVAGQEHRGAREGAVRGLVGGALFGGGILAVLEAIDKQPKADLPHPRIILLAITILVGVVAGALGGRRRAKREEEDEEEKTGFSISRVKRSELIGFLGAIVLALSLFALPWFSTSCGSDREARIEKVHPGGCNYNSKIETAAGPKKRGSFTGWQTYRFVRWALLLSCIAPFVLAYIIARGHQLSWRPGEVTMIIGMIAFALILLDGIILGKPGSSASNSKNGVDISLEIGYLVGMLGSLLMCVGGFRRQAENVKPKPPGV